MKCINLQEPLLQVYTCHTKLGPRPEFIHPDKKFAAILGPCLPEWSACCRLVFNCLACMTFLGNFMGLAGYNATQRRRLSAYTSLHILLTCRCYPITLMAI